MYRSLMFGLAASIVISTAACGLRGGGRATAPAAPAGPTWSALPSTALVYYDNSGGVQDSLRLVIRDAAALREIWQQATAAQTSPPPMPDVNFDQEMVLVVAAGRMTPEDMLRVDSIAVREERVPGSGPKRTMEVVVHTIQGCRTFNSDAYPLAVLRVQRFPGEVRFTERRLRAEGCSMAALVPVRGPHDGRDGR